MILVNRVTTMITNKWR